MRIIKNLYDEKTKFGDTNNTFVLNLYDDNNLVFLNDKKISINIANKSGLVLHKDLENIDIQNINIDFSDEDLSKLTPDTYLLEVVLTLSDGTVAKYPTNGGIQFTITNNLSETTGKIVPTITFDEVLKSVDEKINEYTATIVKGDKGDTGSSALPVAGVYPTLADLINANPEHDRVYITTNNGNWNYWNGTAWVAGGVYQSVGISNNSVTSDMLSGNARDISIYVNSKSGGAVFNIDSINMKLMSSNCYANFGKNSDLIPTITLNLGFSSNIIYYDFALKVLGVTDYVWKLTSDQTLIGTINKDLSVIDLKVTNYSIDGADIKTSLSDKFINHNVYIYGDAVVNIDKKTFTAKSVWLNYDYGSGRAIPTTTIDVSTNTIVYFDTKDGVLKATDQYSKLKDGQLLLGNCSATVIQGSFFNNFSRVFVVKNGITYDAASYKARNALLSNTYMATFGDSITSDQVSGTGTQIMDALGAKKTGNFATGWSTGSDWHNGATNTTTVTLVTPNNTDTNDNVLSNQVRRALQYTTASGAQITWTHPIDGTFSLDTELGTGLGNTDKIPSVIYIAISTNDGKNASVPIVDDTDAVLANNYKDLTRNSLASGLRWAIETLQSAYPNVKIFVASPIQTNHTDGHMSFTNTKLKRDIVEKVAQFTSVYFVDSFSESGFSRMKNKTWTDDGVHPSTLGKPKLVDYVTNEIRKKF